MLGFLLWTLVFVWAFLVAGAAYLAWRYYTTEAPEAWTRDSAPQGMQRRESHARPPVVVPDSG